MSRQCQPRCYWKLYKIGNHRLDGSILIGVISRGNSGLVEVAKSPLVRAAADAERDLLRRGGTPERVEFENSIADGDTGAGQGRPDDELSEIDEDEWTDHNFGNTGAGDQSSSDDASSFDEDDDDDDSRYRFERLSYHFVLH